MRPLTVAIIARVDAYVPGLTAECIICGKRFDKCHHTRLDTAPVFRAVRSLTRAERERIEQHAHL